MDNMNNNTNENPRFVTLDFLKTPMNWDLADMYFDNFENYRNTFSVKTLETILRNYTLHTFATFQYIPLDMCRIYDNRGYYELTKKPVFYSFEECNGAWKKQVNKLSREFIVPCQYQSLKEKEFLKDCLLMDFPYLKNYSFVCYQFEREDSDIYVKTEEKGISLYVPIKAFKEKRPQLVINRMNEYFKEYYNGPDRKMYLDQRLGALEGKIAKNLFEDMASNVEVDNVEYVRCNNCLRIFPEERLELFADEGQEPEEAHKTWYEFTRNQPKTDKPYTFFKGCPFCKTDAFLTDLEK